MCRDRQVSYYHNARSDDQRLTLCVGIMYVFGRALVCVRRNLTP